MSARWRFVIKIRRKDATYWKRLALCCVIFARGATPSTAMKSDFRGFIIQIRYCTYSEMVWNTLDSSYATNAMLSLCDDEWMIPFMSRYKWSTGTTSKRILILKKGFIRSQKRRTYNLFSHSCFINSLIHKVFIRALHTTKYRIVANLWNTLHVFLRANTDYLINFKKNISESTKFAIDKTPKCIPHFREQFGWYRDTVD